MGQKEGVCAERGRVYGEREGECAGERVCAGERERESVRVRKRVCG